MKKVKNLLVFGYVKMSVNQCMMLSTSELKKRADKAGIKYITLDTVQNKLKVCKELSLHQQPLFLNNGINPLVQDRLNEQEKKCTHLCSK